MSEIASIEGIVQHSAVPYAPSWFNRLDTWIMQWPLLGWLAYPALALLSLLLLLLANWSSGVYPAGSIHPFLIVIAVSSSYGMLVMHTLDGMATRALQKYQLVPDLNQATVATLRYRLTIMPARLALFSGSIGMLVGILILRLMPSEVTVFLKLYTSPLSTIVDLSLYLAGWSTGGTLFYHTIHQLREVNRIYTHYTRINLFRLPTLYAFARLTAVTAVCLFLFSFCWLALEPQALSIPAQLLVGVVHIVLGLVTFIWPLYGIHQRLVEAKRQRLDEIAERIDLCITDLQQQYDRGAYEETKRAKEMVESLVVAQRELAQVPSWPWEPGTVRWLATALLLPVLLWLITHFLDRILSF